MARFMHLQHPVLQRCAIQSQPTLFLTEMSERVKHDDGRTVEVTVALQKYSKGKFDYINKTKTSK